MRGSCTRREKRRPFTSRLRKKSELARFLGTPPDEIARLMDEAELPHVRFRLRSYADLEREFDEAQERKTATTHEEKGDRE